jgi:hypothetical protein
MTAGMPSHVPVSVIHCELLPGVACAAEEYRRSPTTAAAAAAAKRRLRRRGMDRGTVRRYRVVPSIAAGMVRVISPSSPSGQEARTLPFSPRSSAPRNSPDSSAAKSPMSATRREPRSSSRTTAPPPEHRRPATRHASRERGRLGDRASVAPDRYVHSSQSRQAAAEAERRTWQAPSASVDLRPGQGAARERRARLAGVAQSGSGRHAAAYVTDAGAEPAPIAGGGHPQLVLDESLIGGSEYARLPAHASVWCGSEGGVGAPS